MAAGFAVVTGATSGIGLETARGLARQGWDLVLACRNAPRAEAVRQELAAGAPGRRVEALALDLASLGSVRAFAAELSARHPTVDLLVNNAGVFCDTREQTVEGFEMTMGVNFLGTFLLTRLVLPLLVASGGARIVNVASAAAAVGRLRPRAGIFTDCPHGMRGYAASKLALIVFTVDLAEELAGSAVTVNAVHPGQVATNIWSGESLLMRLVAPAMRSRLRSPAEGALPVLRAATAPELEGVSGKLLNENGEMPAIKRYRVDALRKDIMRLASEAVGLGGA
jgi:retinol dehydrogenase 14